MRVPALGLGMDPPDAAQMNESPRRANSGLLEGRELRTIGLVGLWMGGAALSAYFWPWHFEGGRDTVGDLWIRNGDTWGNETLVTSPKSSGGITV